MYIFQCPKCKHQIQCLGENSKAYCMKFGSCNQARMKCLGPVDPDIKETTRIGGSATVREVAEKTKTTTRLGPQMKGTRKVTRLGSN